MEMEAEEMEMGKIHSREAESSVRGESAAEVPLEDGDGDGRWKLSFAGSERYCASVPSYSLRTYKGQGNCQVFTPQNSELLFYCCSMQHGSVP